MINKFNIVERITLGRERAYAMSFIDKEDKELQPFLKIPFLTMVLEIRSPFNTKFYAALTTLNTRGFVRRGIENISEEGVDEKVVERMVLVDHYSRFKKPSEIEEEIASCHEFASTPLYQEAFSQTKKEIESWCQLIRDRQESILRDKQDSNNLIYSRRRRRIR